MIREDVDLNLLVALRVLLEETNVTRAALRLNKPQSSTSAALARLRAAFHDELLVQVGRDLEPTPLARRLLPQLQLTLPLIETALGCDDAFDPLTSTRVFRVMVSDDAISDLTYALREATRRAPSVRIDIESITAAPEGLTQELLHADILIAALPALGRETKAQDLMRDRFVCYVDHQHPALHDGRISLGDFLACAHVRVDAGQGGMTPIQHRLRDLGIELDYRVTTSSMLALPAVIVDTELIGVVPARLADRFSMGGRMTSVPLPLPFSSGEAEITQRMSWHSARTGDAGHAWLRETLLTHVRECAARAGPA